MQLHRITCKRIASWHRPHHIHIRIAPVGVLRRTRRVLLLYQLRKRLFEPAIYIQITYDLYIYQKRFIYKMKTICIQIENALYTDCCPTCFKWNFDLWQFLFPALFPCFSPLYRYLFGIVPNSSSLLKTFLAHDF